MTRGFLLFPLQSVSLGGDKENEKPQGNYTSVPQRNHEKPEGSHRIVKKAADFIRKPLDSGRGEVASSSTLRDSRQSRKAKESSANKANKGPRNANGISSSMFGSIPKFKSNADAVLDEADLREGRRLSLGGDARSKSIGASHRERRRLSIGSDAPRSRHSGARGLSRPETIMEESAQGSYVCRKDHAGHTHGDQTAPTDKNAAMKFLKQGGTAILGAVEALSDRVIKTINTIALDGIEDEILAMEMQNGHSSLQRGRAHSTRAQAETSSRSHSSNTREGRIRTAHPSRAHNRQGKSISAGIQGTQRERIDMVQKNTVTMLKTIKRTPTKGSAGVRAAAAAAVAHQKVAKEQSCTTRNEPVHHPAMPKTPLRTPRRESVRQSTKTPCRAAAPMTPCSLSPIETVAEPSPVAFNINIDTENLVSNTEGNESSRKKDDEGIADMIEFTPMKGKDRPIQAWKEDSPSKLSVAKLDDCDERVDKEASLEPVPLSSDMPDIIMAIPGPFARSASASSIKSSSASLDAVKNMQRRLQSRMQKGSDDAGKTAASKDTKGAKDQMWAALQATYRKVSVEEFFGMVDSARAAASVTIEEFVGRSWEPKCEDDVSKMSQRLSEIPQWYPGGTKELKSAQPKWSIVESRLDTLHNFSRVVSDMRSCTEENDIEIPEGTRPVELVVKARKLFDDRKRVWGSLMDHLEEWQKAKLPLDVMLAEKAVDTLVDRICLLLLKVRDSYAKVLSSRGPVPRIVVTECLGAFVGASRLLMDMVTYTGSAPSTVTNIAAQVVIVFHSMLIRHITVTGEKIDTSESAIGSRHTIVETYEDSLRVIAAVSSVFGAAAQRSATKKSVSQAIKNYSWGKLEDASKDHKNLKSSVHNGVPPPPPPPPMPAAMPPPPPPPPPPPGMPIPGGNSADGVKEKEFPWTEAGIKSNSKEIAQHALLQATRLLLDRVVLAGQICKKSSHGEGTGSRRELALFMMFACKYLQRVLPMTTGARDNDEMFLTTLDSFVVLEESLSAKE